KRGEQLLAPLDGQSVLLLGVGDRDKFDLAALRRAGAQVARRTAKAESVATTLLTAVHSGIDYSAAAQALAEGIVLGSYQFLRYKSSAKPSRLTRVQIVGPSSTATRAAAARGVAIAGAVCWARDLVNEPAAAKSPGDIAEIARKVARSSGLKVKVFTGEQLARERFGGVVGVGKGSERPPYFVRLEYAPAGARHTVAFVGKGVVFDSGGLSIKTAAGMETMKTDMSGAAAVIAAMSTLRELKVKARVVAYVPLVENMPSGTAMRPGDVLTMRNGKTVEVINTDAEGRLILADALSLAHEEGADAIVDIATLTGGVTIALGEKIGALMGNHGPMIDQVRAAAARSGERLWQLPLPDDYHRLIESDVADLRNQANPGGGSTITAGLFLQDFVSGTPWAHLDIAGAARASADDAEVSKGGTGFGVRTLIEVARSFRAPK
ncbi:MAG TPA: leucyl aminopeptidase, partial [Acidimicrobiia bacterium]|nr:leucyl aminopeptidase [Acidimicrobiia bacterium]